MITRRNQHGSRAGAKVIRLAATALLCVASVLAQSQFMNPAASQAPGDWKDPAAQGPRALEGVIFEQRLENQVDLSLQFTDSNGQTFALRDVFGDVPVVLSLVYYDCPMLCTLELNGLLKAMRAIDLEAGRDYKVLSVSFDPRETAEMAAEKKDLYLRQYLQGGFYEREPLEKGWTFAVGDEAAIAALTEQVGFRYKYDEASDLYRHASGIVTLTPDGRVSRYQFGVEYSARDLKFNVMEASKGEIGGLADAVMLYCFHYDPVSGKYGFAVMNALRLMGGATLALLGGFVVFNILRERRRSREATATG